MIKKAKAFKLKCKINNAYLAMKGILQKVKPPARRGLRPGGSKELEVKSDKIYNSNAPVVVLQ